MKTVPHRRRRSATLPQRTAPSAAARHTPAIAGPWHIALATLCTLTSLPAQATWWSTAASGASACDMADTTYALMSSSCGSDAAPVGARPAFGAVAANEAPLINVSATRPAGAMADARWLTDWGRFFLRAGVGTGGTSRVISRSFGWQVDDPQRGAALQLGGFISARSALLPQLPLMGVRYASTSANAAAVPTSSSLPRLSDMWRALQSDGAALMPGQLAGLPQAAPVSFGSDMPFTGRGEVRLMAADAAALQAAAGIADNAAPAPLLRPGSTDFALEAGRLSNDPLRVDAGRDVVLGSSVRHGLSAAHTVSATALQVGPSRMWGAASDVRLGAIGTLRAGVSLLDAGEGPHPRSLIGHDFQADGISTRLRLEQRYGGRNEALDASQPTSAAQAALPDDRHNRTGAASIALNRRTQLTVEGLDREPQLGEAARWMSVGASYRVSPGSRISVALQRVTLPEETNRLLLSWQVPLDPRPATSTSSSRGLRHGLAADEGLDPVAGADRGETDASVEQAIALATQR